ncbi:DNA-binding protein [Thalassobaculum fulvum]|uniref:DNA-binding protein n=1 Tax=Thalassobaculum fulvum TaxID=1633335 RepID=A0A919CQ57_9PROT|nr:XRE family transcriptional regulator [Thalassobaculum fulvum]GHD52735.1 DNA-binding protein [Thalassobaculum fulvum]
MARQLTGYRIRERRRQLGLTQAGVAKRVGISPSYLNLIEANKRAIAGATLRRITEVLDLDPDTLTGRTEQRMIDDLVELAAEPMLRDLGLDDTSVGDLVGRHPAWAGALLACWRAYRDQAQTAAALSDRLNQDPALADAVHQLLTHVTTVRSTSEILDTTDDLPAAMRARFHAILSSESARLSEVTQALATFFDKPHSRTRSITAAEEVDDVIIERENHFPALEQAAEELSREIRRHGDILLGALPEYLREAHGVTVANRPPADIGGMRFRNLCAYDGDARRLEFLDHASTGTRQFQMARLAAELAARDLIEREIDDPRLTSPASRTQAYRAFASYVASAVIFPYDRFHADAEEVRYDVEVLRQRYGASFEQVAHRLVTLRRPGREGIPFGFLRSNPAGFTTKRFPLPDLPLPRHGHGCPLWAIYGAFQTPGRVLRQLVQFPDNARYLFVAGTVTKQPASFHEPPVPHSVMLACDVMHADKTVYADGLDLGSAGRTAVPVGPSCRLCLRLDCLHRAEEPIVGREQPAG